MQLTFNFILIVFVFFCHGILSGYLQPILSREVDPSSIIHNVSTLDGSYSEIVTDLVLSGPDSVGLKRSYSNHSSKLSVFGGWLLAPETLLSIKYSNDGSIASVVIGDHNGSFLEFKHELNPEEDATVLKINPNDVVCNTARSNISRWTNLKNYRLEFLSDSNQFILHLPFGAERVYKPSTSDEQYLLVIEKFSTGNQASYQYDNQDRLCEIRVTDTEEKLDMGWIRISYDKEITASSSDGVAVTYNFFGAASDQSLLTKVEDSRGNHIRYEYKLLDEQALLTRKTTQTENFLAIEYEKEGPYRVKSLSYPFGQGETAHLSFTYEEQPDGTRITKLLSPGQKQTLYHFDKNQRLIAIEEYLDDKPYRIKKRKWGLGKDLGNLISASVEDADGSVWYYQSFSYDDVGNILQCREYGNFTGLQTEPIAFDDYGHPKGECHLKQYRYFTEENEDVVVEGESLQYRYKRGTNQLLFKGILENGEIQKQHFYRYKNGSLDRLIIADGDLPEPKVSKATTQAHITEITLRDKFPNFGAPEVIKEKAFHYKSRKQVLVKKTVNQFDLNGNVVAQKIYGENDSLLYMTSRSYDDRNRIVREVDAQGKEVCYAYDDANRLIQETTQSKEIAYEYDLQNRVTRVVEVFPDGSKDKVFYSFDAQGNKITERDLQGAQTRYQYDGLGRLVSISYPEVVVNGEELVHPEYMYSYDLFDHPTSIIDPKGNCTNHTYNIRGKVIRSQYPDEQEEHFQYKISGSLWKHQRTDGITQTFTYDPFGNISAVHFYEVGGFGAKPPFRKDRYRYNAFHLLAKDENNSRSFFEYDAQGRLERSTQATNESIVRTSHGYREETENGRTQEFFYDQFGNIESIKKWKTDNTYSLYIQRHNLLGQLEEERIESEKGETLFKKRYIYNEQGQLASITGCPQNQESRLLYFEYDHKGRVIKKVDATGAETSYDYDENYIDALGKRALLKTTTDPMGNQTKEVIYLSGQVAEIIHQDASGSVLSKVGYNYDINQTLLSENAQSLEGYSNTATHSVFYSLNHEGQLESITQGSGCLRYKQKSYLYDPYGRVSDVHVPGFEKPVHYEYDANGDLQSITYGNPNQSCAYTFKKKAKDRVLIQRINDKKRGVRSQFDESGILLAETYVDEKGSYGLEIGADDEGCITKITLPDQSYIQYFYDGPFVKAVARYSARGKKLYCHKVSQRDGLGQPILEILPGELGEIRTQYDELGRKAEIQTKYFSEIIGSFDPNGNLLEKASITQYEECSEVFKYDGLSRLIAEQGRESNDYEYDALSNCITSNELLHEINQRNQLQQVGDSLYEYDASGNLQSRMDTSGKTVFQFDALGRLIAVEKGKEHVKYTYDAWGRRLTKQVDSESGPKTYRYFYLGSYELGCIDEQGKIVELRLPSNPNDPDRAEIVSIELNNRVFVPVQDIQGNVRCLVDLKTKQVVESYKYSAFGSETIFNAEGKPISESRINNPWRYQSKRKDGETGLMYFGQRYYDPQIRRWISPDPLGTIDGPNPYTFTRNNPFKYVDPFGLASEAKHACACGYCKRGEGCHCRGEITERIDQCQCLGIACCHETRLNITSAGIDLSAIARMGADRIGAILSNPHFHGSMQAFGGLAEAGVGAGMTYVTAGAAAPVGWPVMAHGIDQFFTGLQTAITGEYRDTVSSYLLQQTGMSRENATFVNDCISVAGTVGGTAAIRSAQLTAYYFRLPTILKKPSKLPENPLRNMRYTKKVLMQMERNLKTGKTDFHGFPRMVDNYAGFGKKELIQGKDRLTRMKITLEGTYKRQDGYFEWIIESNGTVNHRVFIPNS